MIAEFIAHLKANVTATIHYAYTAEATETESDELPAVWVYPGSYSADQSGIDNFVRQSLREEIVCMFACRVADYEALRDELRGAALGWVYQEYDAFELVGGEMEALNGGYIWMRETYTTKHLITEGN